MARDRLRQLGRRHPACFEMFVAQHGVARSDQTAHEGQDAHEVAGQHLEQVLVECRADLDLKPGLLTDFALQRRAMVLAGIGPTARQVPFAAFVQEQQHASVMDQHAFDGDGKSGHDNNITKGPEIALRPFRNFSDGWT